MSFLRYTLAVAVALLVAALPGYGQAVSARLEGSVKDSSEAVVQRAAVKAINEDTGARAEAVTNEAGRYLFPNLAPGRYTLSAELDGFKKTQAQFTLQVGDARTVDLSLTPGEVSESIDVTDSVSPVNTATTKIGAVVENRQAVDLPLNGRDAMMLFYLQAGTSPIDRFASQQQTGVVDGLAPHTSAIKVEGILASNPGYDYSPSHPSMPVPQEAVGEYRVTTSSDSSDAGKGSGAQVKVLIRSGTNDFHGSVFEFNRNTLYNANDFFNNRDGAKRPVLLRNQFGFALGGPIIRNRTFVFATAEWQKQTQESIENRTVYTPALRSGIFRYNKGGTNSSAIVDRNGVPTIPAGQIGEIDLVTVDPTRQGFDTVFLPKILGVMPAPNNYDLGDGLNTAGYRYNTAIPYDYYQFLVKLDHSLTERHRLSLTLSQYHEENPQARMYNGISPEGFTELRRGASLRIISSLSPSFMNELSVGANVRLAERPNTNPAQQTAAGNVQLVGLGTGGVNTGGTNGNINSLRSSQRNPAVNEGFQNTSTWVRSNHTLAFGGEYWHQTLNRTTQASEYPVIRTDNASNPATIPALSGLSSTDRARAQQLTNDLTGAVGSVTQSFYLNSRQGYTPYANLYQQMRKNEFAFFVQDIWRVLPNLSLNLGLRYDVLPAAYIGNVYAYPVGGVAGALGVQGPTGKPTQWDFAPNSGKDVFRTDRNNFAPSVGLVWDPFGGGKTAIRASYRTAYDRSMLVSGDFSSPNYGTNSNVTLNPFTRLSDPSFYGSVLPIPAPEIFAPLGFDRQGRAYVADPGLSTPFVHQWSFGIERQVLRDWKVEASYVGNHAVGAWRGINLNQVEIRSNGFLDAFRTAQQNLAQNGSPTTGQSLGRLQPLFALVPSGQYTLINQGQVAALADFLDTTTLRTGSRGGLLGLAGLPDTFFRYNPQVQNLNLVGNRGHSTWNGLKLGVQRQFHNGVYLQANYTVSKGFTDAVPDQQFTTDYRDNANPRLDKGLSPLDSTHVVLINGVWELPFGYGKRFLKSPGGIAQYIFGGWQVNGIYNFTTGRPVQINTGRYNLSQNIASTANFSGGFANLGTVDKSGNQVRFISADQVKAFTNPGAGEAGGLPVYAFHGPGMSTLDASLFKSIRLPQVQERLVIQLRLEFFNVLNQVSFRPAGTQNINSGSFGVLTSAYPARIGQIAAKISF